jgi:DNA-directed RNA polymerase specialized sigma24 family protein
MEPVGAEQLTPVRRGFDEFYACEYVRMIRRATLLCGSPSGAHDLVQDVFVEVFARWELIDLPGPYVQRSVVRACRRYQARADARVGRPAPGLVPTVDLQPDEVSDLLAQLSFRQRAAVVLRFYEDLSEEEIARQLGCRPGTVGSLIHRALRRLRSELA